MDTKRSLADRVFELLLYCYPHSFRQQFGSDMAVTFRTRLADVSARGENGFAFWSRTIRDAFLLGGAARIRSLRGSPNLRPKRSTPSRGSFVTHVAKDLRLALRMLIKYPGLAAVAIVALALGIGATTTTFSITYATILRGLPFEQADQLVHFERQRSEGGEFALAVTPHDYVAWRVRQRSFEDLGAYVEALIHLNAPNGYTERHWGVYINPVSFRLLRVQPALGRLFTEAEATPGGPDVIVLSHRLWQNRFAGDSSIVGRDISINNASATVIGVMPSGFGFPIAEEFWRPLRIDLTQIQRGDGRLDVFGRLKPDVSIVSARSEFELISAGLAAQFPETNRGIAASLSTFHDEYVGEDFTRIMYTMLAGGVLVLAIACANVASVLIARATSRRKEVAVRGALGAGRVRLISQFLIEALVLSSIGAAGGIAIATVGVSWFAAGAQAGVFQLPHGGDSLFWWDIRLDWISVAFVLAVTLLTTVVAGTAPAVHAARTPVSNALNEESRGSSSRVLAVFGRAMVVSEIALTAGLLMAAGLAVKSVLRLSVIEDNIDSDAVLTARIALPQSQFGIPGERFPDHRTRVQFLERTIAELEARPEVRVAAVGNVLPVDGGPVAAVELEGEPYAQGHELPEVRIATVDHRYLELFGVEPIEGRTFTSMDGAVAEPVAIVNTSFVQRHLPNRHAINTRIRLGASPEEPWTRIVGVVPNLWSPSDAARDQSRVFVPLSQSETADPTARLGRWGLRVLTIALKGSTVTPPVETLRATLAAIDPDIPPYAVQSMSDAVAARGARYRLYGRYYVVFAGAALALALVGVYGVMSFSVSRRRAEFGIRMALGAAAPSVLRSVLSQTMLQIGVGLTLGAMVAYWLAQGLRHALFQVDVWDPFIMLFVPAVLVITGIAAGLVPALRAARVDPLESMRGG